jgi:hypothetical protein
MSRTEFSAWQIGLLLAAWLVVSGCSGGMQSWSLNASRWVGAKTNKAGRLPGDMIPPARDVGLANDQ